MAVAVAVAVTVAVAVAVGTMSDQAYARTTVDTPPPVSPR